MLIDGKEVKAAEKIEHRSPINQDWLLAVFQKGNADDARTALAAARRTFPKWSHTPWRERVRLLRKAADLIDKRIYEFGVVMSLEVGKNRMEALGDAAGIGRPDPLLLRPDGGQQGLRRAAWARTRSRATPPPTPRSCGRTACGSSSARSTSRAPSPAGPAGAALVAGNTLVMKPATNTPVDRSACWPSASAMPASRMASSTTSPARAAASARS